MKYFIEALNKLPTFFLQRQDTHLEVLDSLHQVTDQTELTLSPVSPVSVRVSQKNTNISNSILLITNRILLVLPVSCADVRQVQLISSYFIPG